MVLSKFLCSLVKLPNTDISFIHNIQQIARFIAANVCFNDTISSLSAEKLVVHTVFPFYYQIYTESCTFLLEINAFLHR